MDNGSVRVGKHICTDNTTRPLISTVYHKIPHNKKQNMSNQDNMKNLKSRINALPSSLQLRRLFNETLLSGGKGYNKLASKVRRTESALSDALSGGAARKAQKEQSYKVLGLASRSLSLRKPNLRRSRKGREHFRTQLRQRYLSKVQKIAYDLHNERMIEGLNEKWSEGQKLLRQYSEYGTAYLRLLGDLEYDKKPLNDEEAEDVWQEAMDEQYPEGWPDFPDYLNANPWAPIGKWQM